MADLSQAQWDELNTQLCELELQKDKKPIELGMTWFYEDMVRVLKPRLT